MKSNKETIDRVQGEWRTVTNADVKNDSHTRVRESKNHKWHVLYPHIGAHLLFHAWEDVQQFFPVTKPAKQKRKVAKVTIKKGAYYRVWFKLDRMCKFTPEFAYSSRKSALRGARRFCKSIGYECEVAK